MTPLERASQGTPPVLGAGKGALPACRATVPSLVPVTAGVPAPAVTGLFSGEVGLRLVSRPTSPGSSSCAWGVLPDIPGVVPGIPLPVAGPATRMAGPACSQYLGASAVTAAASAADAVRRSGSTRPAGTSSGPTGRVDPSVLPVGPLGGPVPWSAGSSLVTTGPPNP